MKIRQGFVSNSSTTSFCIYGAMIPSSKIKDMWSLAEEVGLECFCPEYNDGYCVGISWSSVGDDETGRQFKDRVEALVEKLVGKKVLCQTHEEAWRDG